MALLDSGSEENLMSEELSQKLRLPRRRDREVIYIGAGGQVKSDICVDSRWHLGQQTHDVTFRLIPNLPVDIVFSFAHCKKYHLMFFPESASKVKILLPLAMKKESQGRCG